MEDRGTRPYVRGMKFHGIFAAAVAVSAIAAAQAGAGASPPRPVVVELYTSQGCNSCPPADALLAQLASRKDVLALTLPVTYWDMLGWKDTYGTESNTHRQESYANVMGRGGVYTPQMIIDGVDDVVGSRQAKVMWAIETREADMTNVPVDVSETPDYLRVVIGASPKIRTDATIWMFHILSHGTADIGAGENQGRKLTYRNIVRDVRTLGPWKGDSVSIAMPRHEFPGPYDDVAVVLQQGGYGRVIGAAELKRSASGR